MKAILMSIKPKWVAKILNGDLSVLVRKKFSKDYVGWVYVYCASHKNYHESLYKVCEEDGGGYDVDYYVPSEPDFILNNKVVARFWCNKVEEISFYQHRAFFNDGYEKKPTVVWQDYHTKSYACGLLEEPSCFTYEELHDYLKGDKGYAIHITKVEPFDKPKEISEFWTSNYNKGAMCDNEPQFPCTKCPNTGALYCSCKFLLNGNCSCISLTRAPQSYCFIEV